MATTAFLGVLEDKLKKKIKKIDGELTKAKQDRDRELLRRELKTTKELKKTVKRLRKEAKIVCPHCEGEFHLDTV